MHSVIRVKDNGAVALFASVAVAGISAVVVGMLGIEARAAVAIGVIAGACIAAVVVYFGATGKGGNS